MGGHLYCLMQLSMFNMEKLYRNKIIIIININIGIVLVQLLEDC